MLNAKFLITTISLYFLIKQVNSSLPCKFIDTVNITGGYIDSDQNLIYKDDVFPSGTYKEFNYVENHTGNKTKVDSHIRGCICKLKTCIRYCCAKRSPDCPSFDTFNVINEDNDEEIIDLSDNKYGVLFGRPCDEMYMLEPEFDENDNWNFLKNGSILAHEIISSTDEYCLTKMTSETDVTVLLCFNSNDDPRYSLYPIGMLISIPFLIITFLVYACIPELRNLHGKCLMCYTFALMMLYASLAIVQINVFDMQGLQRNCAALGYFVYFSAFLSFFWMNVMCFDIWSIAKHGMTNRSFKEDRKTFLYYSIYAFGLTIFITTTAIIIDTFKLLDEKYLPSFGIKRCFLAEDSTVEAIYLYIPISIIFIANIFFFVGTARIIWRVQGISNDENTQNRKVILRNRFFIYCRLFFIMGLMWCMETISWIYEKNHIIFYISDFFNCIQGLLIFIVCVCERRTRLFIVDRCCANIAMNDESTTYVRDIHSTNVSMAETK